MGNGSTPSNKGDNDAFVAKRRDNDAFSSAKNYPRISEALIENAVHLFFARFRPVQSAAEISNFAVFDPHVTRVRPPGFVFVFLYLCIII